MRAENETRGAEGGGNIDNRFGSRRADSVSEERLLVAGLLFGFAKNRVRLCHEVI